VGTITPFAEDYFLTSYSYQKENLGYGLESWSLTSKPIVPSYGGTIVMLRTGFAEGTISTGDGFMTSTQMGVTVDETGSNDSSGNPIQGESGSVQAGGIGDFQIQRNIVATEVGGSLGFTDAINGLAGTASVSVSMTPVFL
jgi:hypothetical protein